MNFPSSQKQAAFWICWSDFSWLCMQWGGNSICFTLREKSQDKKTFKAVRWLRAVPLFPQRLTIWRNTMCLRCRLLTGSYEFVESGVDCECALLNFRVFLILFMFFFNFFALFLAGRVAFFFGNFWSLRILWILLTLLNVFCFACFAFFTIFELGF